MPACSGSTVDAWVLVPRPFDEDDEDSEEDSDGTEERYEFNTPKPVIEASELEPYGAYTVFVGKLVGTCTFSC